MNPDDKRTKATPLLPTEPPRYPISTLKERGKRDTNRKAITKDPEPSHASGDPSEEEDGIEDSENEKTIGRYNADITTVRQRYPTSIIKIPDRAAAQHNPSMSGEITVRQAHVGSFLSLVANDGWRLIKTALGLSIRLYPICKWFLLGYTVWLAITCLVTSIYRSTTAVLDPICSTPYLGPQIPFCTVFLESKDRPVNVSKVATSQDVLTVVMDRVGQNFDLPRDTVGHEFAVRDFKIRVAASGIARKKELARELESLIRYTKQTAK